MSWTSKLKKSRPAGPATGGVDAWVDRLRGLRGLQGRIDGRERVTTQDVVTFLSLPDMNRGTLDKVGRAMREAGWLKDPRHACWIKAGTGHRYGFTAWGERVRLPAGSNS